MLFHLLYPLRRIRWLTWLNVVRYPSTRIISSSLTAILLSFLLGPWFIRKLQSRQIGQTIREDGPQSHLAKAGTPTMGGSLILLALIVPTLLWCDLRNQLVWLVLAVTVGYGAIGFLDDSLKLRFKNSKGLPGRLKMLGQLLIGGAAVAFLLHGTAWPAAIRHRFALPFVHFDRHPLSLHPLVYLAFGTFVVVGSSNAVNLTDGLDGLAIGPVIMSAGTFLILSYVAGTVLGFKSALRVNLAEHVQLPAGVAPQITLRKPVKFNMAEYLNVPHIPGAEELAVYCSSMIGAGIGFLWYNTYPASVFMGDIGSLSLGGGLGMLAVLTKNEFVWAICGGIFVLEAASVIVQVLSFKLTGKRVFRMAPIHHHFELKGWAEPKVIVRFWILSIMLALFALGTLKLR